jgi:phage virion morphogenesis protein
MAGVNIRVRWDDRGVKTAFRNLGRQVDNLSPVFKDIGEALLRSVEGRFAAQVDPDGKRWKPLSARTKKRKRGNKILTERRRLRRSIVYKAARDGVEVGTNVIYAAIHQLGGKVKQKARTQVMAFKRGGRLMSRSAARRSKAKSIRVAFASIGARELKIPARPYLGLSSADVREILMLVHEHLERALKPRQ